MSATHDPLAAGPGDSEGLPEFGELPSAKQAEGEDEGWPGVYLTKAKQVRRPLPSQLDVSGTYQNNDQVMSARYVRYLPEKPADNALLAVADELLAASRETQGRHPKEQVGLRKASEHCRLSAERAAPDPVQELDDLLAEQATALASEDGEGERR